MGIIDVGDLLPDFGFTVVSNSTGALTAPSSFAVTLTAPDGTTPAVTVTNPSTGIYGVAHVATMAGRYVAVGTATGNGCDGASTLIWDVEATGADQQPIVSVDELRVHLGKGLTTSDDELRRYALIGTELAEEWLGRTLRRRTVTERHDGGMPEVLLLVSPVLSVTSVTADGAALAASAYDLDDLAGILISKSGAFPGGRNDLAVTYLAGPAGNLAARYGQGVREIARHLWDTQRGGSNLPRQQGAEDVWTSGAGWSVPRRVMELLGRRAPGFA